MTPNEQLFLYDGPIEVVTWGRYLISGKMHGFDCDGNILGAGKDIILNKNEAISWNQRKGHSLTKEMLVPTLNMNLEILIIGNGFDGKLEVSDELKAEIAEERGITVCVLKTPEACGLYNKLFFEKKNVFFAGHVTC